MSKKKGFFANLFGGYSSDCCNMKIVDEDNKGKSKQKKSSCCDMKIVEDISQNNNEK